MKNKLLKISAIVFSILFLVMCKTERISPNKLNSGKIGLHKLEYNNPGLLVDLDVGFKSVPMPMDFDGDGDLDLLVSESSSYAESGVFYFENISGNVDMHIFRFGMEVSSERFR